MSNRLERFSDEQMDRLRLKSYISLAEDSMGRRVHP
jgi:hypothetical protein